jgi:hypothetical protein
LPVLATAPRCLKKQDKFARTRRISAGRIAVACPLLVQDAVQREENDGKGRKSCGEKDEAKDDIQGKVEGRSRGERERQDGKQDTPESSASAKKRRVRG